jgi:hypothetical protein
MDLILRHKIAAAIVLAVGLEAVWVGIRLIQYEMSPHLNCPQNGKVCGYLIDRNPHA